MADRTFIDTDDREQLLIDGDTITNDSGKRYRLDGIDTLETDKIITEDGKPRFKRGEFGGEQHTDVVAQIIKEGNFNRMNYSGNIDKSKGEREIISLSNPDGEDLVETLYKAGAAKINPYTSKRSIVAQEEGELLRSLFGEDAVQYSDIANEFNDYTQQGGLTFKGLALNESEYNPEIHNGVQFRSPDRTIDNQALGILSSAGIAYDQGWEGVKEGLWGYADALGQVTGFEMLETLGENGVARARERMSNQPEITLDYQEIDGVRTGFEYMLNNTAMMIPQMLTLFGSMALAAPIGMLGAPTLAGLTALTPISLISAGQTWNEMEGEKGVTQFVAASVAGVGIAALERFGLQKLVAPAKVLSKEGSLKVIRAIADKEKISMPMAKQKFDSYVKQEIGKFSKAFAVRFDSKDFRGFSFRELGKRAATGFGVEASTEVLQDTLQMATAATFADNEYSGAEIKNRLINAGLAGGVVGGKLGAAASILQQGKTRMMALEREEASADKFNLIENRKRDLVQQQQRTGNPNQGTDNVETILKRIPSAADMNNVPDDKNYKGLTKKLHDEYKAKEKGVSNYLKNNEDLFQYISAAMGGAAKLVLAAERNLGKMAKMVKSAKAMEIFHLAAAETTGRLHQGGNYKETQDLIAGDIASNVDERGIANLFGQKKLTNKNIENISMQIKDFATPTYDKDGNVTKPSDFEMFEAMLYSELGAFKPAKMLVDPPRATKKAIKEIADRANISLAMAKKRFDSYIVREQAAAMKVLGQIGLMNIEQVKNYYAIAKKDDPINGVVELGLTKEQENAQKIIYLAAKQIKNGYDSAFTYINEAHINETTKEIRYDPDYWWKHRGFNWKKVKANRKGFFQFLQKNTGLSDAKQNELYESIVRDGQGNINVEQSLIEGTPYMPYAINKDMVGLNKKDIDNEFFSDNMFEALRRDRLEAAKYTSATDYFGHGGRKLDFLFDELRKEQAAKPDGDPDKMSPEEIAKMAFYTQSMINSTHGNFNRIESKTLAAVNSFLTGWSILAGLPLAMLSSIPETPLVYFNVKDDVEFNAATKQFISQIGQLFDKTLKAEVEQTERVLKKINQSTDTNSVVDRLATGERDVAFLKMHEAFFSGIGLTKITQVQRRMNAGMAVDFIRSGFSKMSLAPRKIEITYIDNPLYDNTKKFSEKKLKVKKDLGFDFDKFQDIEMRTYNQLSDLGFDVERLMDALADLDNISRDEVFNTADISSQDTTSLVTDRKLEPNRITNIQNPSLRANALRQAVKNSSNKMKDFEGTALKERLSNGEVIEEAARLQLYIDEKMDLAVYRYVKERVQLPSSANRPLAFQDPHYQLIFQFNGFLSTFTGNLVPKIWNAQLRKGTPKVKYDTFALIITMMALGGASQYLKDLIKFGGSTPYLDSAGLIQRAIFSSGVLGQYERVIDLIHPLYPERDSGADMIFNKILGEAGPSARNIGKVYDATSLALQGDGTKAVKKALGIAPIIGPFTGTRNAIGDTITGNPPKINIPESDDIIDFLLS